MNPILARVRDPVRVVRIHFRLRLLLDCGIELRRLIDEREAVCIDRLLASFLECLFIDRNDLATRSRSRLRERTTGREQERACMTNELVADH
ncbi:hypothetical protein GCM10009000_035450 [Halobacterium noricense]